MSSAIPLAATGPPLQIDDFEKKCTSEMVYMTAAILITLGLHFGCVSGSLHLLITITVVGETLNI